MLSLTTHSTADMNSPSPLLDCGIDHETISLVVLCLNFVLFVPALLLNVMAAWISWHLKTKSSFVVYLKNLVVADLLMTLIIPLKAASEIPRKRSVRLRASSAAWSSTSLCT